MKKNKLFASFIGAVLMVSFFSVLLSCGPKKQLKQENSIVGEWFPLNTSQSGLGEGYTFKENGKFTAATGAFVTFRYELEGETLIMILPGEGEQKTKVEIDSSKLVFIKKDGNTEFTRIEGDINAGIIGKWSGEYSAGTKQIIDFTASKKLYISVPMTSEFGTYEIKGDAVELSGKVDSSYKWSVEGDSLTLTAIADENSNTYVRLK